VIYIIYNMIYRITFIAQQYGLSEILPFLSRVDAVLRDLYYNTGALAIIQYTVHNTSGTTESDLEWPTPLMTSVL
jgi:hypothetical protein